MQEIQGATYIVPVSILSERLRRGISSACLRGRCSTHWIRLRSSNGSLRGSWRRWASCLFAWDLHIDNKAAGVESTTNERAVLVQLAFLFIWPTIIKISLSGTKYPQLCIVLSVCFLKTKICIPIKTLHKTLHTRSFAHGEVGGWGRVPFPRI